MSSTINSASLPPEQKIERHPVDTDALRLAGTLTRLVRLLEGALRHGDVDDGLTIAHVSVLWHVDQGNDLPSVIARALRLDPARVTRITDNLFALGYLDRGTDPADRRRCILRLTEAGVSRLLLAESQLSDAMTSVLDVLPHEERASLMRSVESVRGVIDEQ